MLKLRNRVVFLFVLLCMLITAMVVRLGYIHIVWAPELEAHAKGQQVKEIPIKAKRGDILDTKGNRLAFSISKYSVWAHASGITKPHETAKVLAEVIEIDEQEVTSKIVAKTSDYVKVANGLSKSDADLIRSKGIWGISVEEETERIYPYGALAPYVIGNVNNAQNGFLGIELYYNDVLTGTPGMTHATTDVYGRQLAYGKEAIEPPVDGLDIRLTIDDTLQYFVEERLKQTFDTYDPLSVSAVILDPRNGDVLAMAKYPSYDLTNPFNPQEPAVKEKWETMTKEERVTYLQESWRNTIVSDIYEPGSVMKILTAAIAIEEGKVSLNEHFYCKGYKEVDGTKLRCISYGKGGHGDQTFLQAFANSCNPVFIELIQRLKPEDYFKYFEKLGIPGKTGIDLPSEAMGMLISKEGIRGLDYATLSYGHGMSLNMVQVASIIATLVNNGDAIEPHLVKGFYKDGELVENYEPQIHKGIFSDKTVNAVRGLLQYAVDNKYTKSVKLEGLSLGGKTGTSVKIVDGRYSDEHVMASFTGVFPMESPEYVVYVTVDEPKVDVTKVPVSSMLGRSIIDDILRYKNIVPEAKKKKQVKVPDLSGLSYKEAKEKLEKLKLKVATDPYVLEEGISYSVKDQFPKAGLSVDEESTIILSVKEE